MYKKLLLFVTNEPYKQKLPENKPSFCKNFQIRPEYLTKIQKNK